MVFLRRVLLLPTLVLLTMLSGCATNIDEPPSAQSSDAGTPKQSSNTGTLVAYFSSNSSWAETFSLPKPLMIDGKTVGHIRSGKYITCTLEPGSYEVSTPADLLSFKKLKRKFSVTSGKTTYVQFSAGVAGKYVYFLIAQGTQEGASKTKPSGNCSI